MFKKEGRISGRYDTQRKFKLIQSGSKKLSNKTSSYRHGCVVSNIKKSFNNLNSSEINSKPPLKPVPPKNKEKAKQAQTLNKLRQQFLTKSNYNNYILTEPSEQVAQKQAKEKIKALKIDDLIGVEELHYQMVKLHQNVKKRHQEV